MPKQMLERQVWACRRKNLSDARSSGLAASGDVEMASALATTLVPRSSTAARNASCQCKVASPSSK